MKNEVNEVNVNLTLVFDHENLDDLYKACGIDIDKVKQFIPNLVFNCIYNSTPGGLRKSKIIEWIIKNMPADYLGYLVVQNLIKMTDILEEEELKNNHDGGSR